MALFRLLDELMRDRSLRRRFGVDAKDVMSEYGLSQRERRILLTMNPAVVAPNVPAEMRDEVTAFQIPPGEFPPMSDDFLAEGGGLDPQYPSPAPGIFRYRTNPPLTYVKDTTTAPPTVIRGFSADLINTTSSGSIELTLFGQSLNECQLKLVRVLPNDAAEAVIAEFHILGTFRNSILRALFNAPGGGTWTANHRYEVTVVNLHQANAPLKQTLKAKPLLVVLP